MADAPQNYANHSRLHPPYHFVASPLLLLAVVLSLVIGIRGIVAGPSVTSVLTALWMVALSVGTFVAAFYTRIYALKVQDRVIAIEVERRYERLGGVKNTPLAEKLKPGQLVALRFAGDTELVALADRAAAESLNSKSIKQAVQNWRGDYRRI